MLDVLVYIAEFFGWLFLADKRPEARQITIGCGLIVLLAIGCFVLWVSWQRGFR